MNSVTSLSNASGLSVMSLAQAKSQNVLNNLTSNEQSLVGSADKSIVMTLSSSGFQETVVNALNSDRTSASGSLLNNADYYAKYNAMSSADISSMLYSGGGFQSGSSSETVDSYMTRDIGSSERLAEGSANLLKWVADGRPNDAQAVAALDDSTFDDWTDAQLKTWTEGEYTRAYAGWSDDQVNASAQHTIQSMGENVAEDQQIIAAFANKTLTIQKASDVEGFDYQETVVWSEKNGRTYEQNNQSYNDQFAITNTNIDGGTDGKMHAMAYIGPTMLWLTW